jgi:hypothetical protein
MRQLGIRFENDNLKTRTAIETSHRNGFKCGRNANAEKQPTRLKYTVPKPCKPRTGFKPEDLKLPNGKKGIVAQRNDRGRNAK